MYLGKPETKRLVFYQCETLRVVFYFSVLRKGLHQKHFFLLNMLNTSHLVSRTLGLSKRENKKILICIIDEQPVSNLWPLRFRSIHSMVKNSNLNHIPMPINLMQPVKLKKIAFYVQKSILRAFGEIFVFFSGFFYSKILLLLFLDLFIIIVKKSLARLVVYLWCFEIRHVKIKDSRQINMQISFFFFFFFLYFSLFLNPSVLHIKH